MCVETQRVWGGAVESAGGLLTQQRRGRGLFHEELVGSKCLQGGC
jgi:hypothetical protein